MHQFAGNYLGDPVPVLSLEYNSLTCGIFMKVHGSLSYLHVRITF